MLQHVERTAAVQQQVVVVDVDERTAEPNKTIHTYTHDGTKSLSIN